MIERQVNAKTGEKAQNHEFINLDECTLTSSLSSSSPPPLNHELFVVQLFLFAEVPLYNVCKIEPLIKGASNRRHIIVLEEGSQ